MTLRIFINHRQEQQPNWLGTAEFAYNNKVYSSTKTLPFKANYEQDPRIGFKTRIKGKYGEIKEFVTKMKQIQEEAKTALGKALIGIRIQTRVNARSERQNLQVALQLCANKQVLGR